MFGFEKKKKPIMFEFDLEKELKDDTRQKELMQKTETRIHDIKNSLRQGSDPESFGQLGTLLHGYSALLKILSDTKLTK